MFVLDTNVLSAMMRVETDDRLGAWLAAKMPDELFTTTISQAEILSGLAIMPAGRRRLALEGAAHAMFQDDFARRILPFDDAAAVVYAALFARRRELGRPATTLDLMIAAIASTRRASVVTRDVGGFAECGLTVVDPWAM